MPGPARTGVFSISAGIAFVDALAAGILDRFGSDPAALSDIRILLPTRRACRALGEAFLRATGGVPLLLPAMIPIGDIDEDEIGFLTAEEPSLAGVADLPPAIPALRRQLLLTTLIMARDKTISAAHAARLAAELARLLDEAQTERLDFAELAQIVPERFSLHWQETLVFLQIVTEHWPAVLAEQGCLDPADRRNRLIEAQIALWTDTPPGGPVIAAGSTGSIPATAELLACVARLEQGAVVLPGLDTTLDEASIAALAPSHPQYGMARLLDRMGLAVADIADWESQASGDAGVSPGRERFEIVNAALRPPETASRMAPEDAVEAAFGGVSRIDCPGPQQEALVIALMLREALELPDRTAALVTPDRRLARRVAAELRRWNIDIDDSGGTPLADTVPGTFLRLTAEAIAADAAPVPLLAALKHPLAAGGMNPAAFRERVRSMEIAALRGPRPAPGFPGLRASVGSARGDADLDDWVAGLEAAAAPFSELLRSKRVAPGLILDAHVDFAERLAASDGETGIERLWAGDAGENAASLINELRASAETLPPVDGREWPALLDTLMQGVVVRPQYGRHPRLNIWGLLEARLQQADVMILGGLNEGVWPPAPPGDPWMSRPMRSAFGLAPPERRIGLTAHDFVQGFAAPQVTITRSTRVDGSPTVPARWLARLDTLISGAGSGDAVLRRWSAEQTRWLRWQGGMDSRLPLRPTPPPAAAPPVEARPENLSVTEVETLIRDPYAIYAKKVLGLRPLDPIDAGPGAADRGSIIHNAIDAFLQDVGSGALPDDAYDRLIDRGVEKFAPWNDRPGVRAFWWPKFERIAAWIVAFERERAPDVARRFTEISGRYDLPNRLRPFHLTGRADRVDALSDGTYEIIDYKTGGLPSKSDVDAGLSPQLPLEAAMIREGAFDDLAPGSVSALTYWKLSGGNPAGDVRAAGGDPEQLADQALAGLIALLDRYEDADTAYLARPNADIAPRYNDYDHLERVQEWAAATGGGE